MNLKLTKESKIYKRVLILKPMQRDGLILNIERSNSKSRFTHSAFSSFQQILILASNDGTLFCLDFAAAKFWNLPCLLNSCTILALSPESHNELFISDKSGFVHLINFQTGQVTGALYGHSQPIRNISFSQDQRCITTAKDNAILWDLETGTKLQCVSEGRPLLKFVMFVPITNDILACFENNQIQIWQSDTLETKTQISPMVWYNHAVRNIVFTKDGRVMMLGCRSPYLALFHLNNYKLFKFITLPEYIQTIKQIEFVPQAQDGGAHKRSAILSGRGTIYFYDLAENLIVSQLIANEEILSFSVALRGNYISCVLCSGDVSVYNSDVYTNLVTEKTENVRANVVGRSVKLRKYWKQINSIKLQIRNILDRDKLITILKECGEFPEQYRAAIWEQLLHLPNNRDEYNAIINNRIVSCFKELSQKYPLENKRALTNLRRLLDNIVQWNQFFHNVSYLPNFVFPFVKVFQNKPVACFEAVCTIIMNWCQYWFEYYPLPPINILAMIENVLMEWDGELLSHFVRYNVPSTVYSWQILKTVFSEVLTAESWKIFWDHVLINEPAFLLCAVVAYNVIQRKKLLALHSSQKFDCFYQTYRPINVRKLILKTYEIFEQTCSSNHPRQYLKNFERLGNKYPDFCDYPKTTIIKDEIIGDLKQVYSDLKTREFDLYKNRFSQLKQKENDMLLREEERRKELIQKALDDEILHERECVDLYKQKISDLQRKFQEEDPIWSTKTLIRQQQSSSLTNTQKELLKTYSGLLKSKGKIEHPDFTIKQLVDEHQEELSRKISEIITTGSSEHELKMLNLFTALLAMDKLMNKIELELENEKRGNFSSESVAHARVLQLKTEAHLLDLEVKRLLLLLADWKNRNQE